MRPDRPPVLGNPADPGRDRPDAARLKREEADIRASIKAFQAPDRVSRDAAQDRGR